MKSMIRAAVLSGALLYGTPHLLGQTVRSVPIERLPIAVRTGMLAKVVARNDRLYLLDSQHHALVVVTGKTSIQIGGIGNGPGELYQPSDFALDRRSWAFVVDGGNQRIEIFDGQGKYAGGFPLTQVSLGIAVDSRGDVLLGQPQIGKLVTAYDLRGKPLRSFGDLVKPSDVYGPKFRKYDTDLTLFNRVRLATDDAGNAWVALQNMPLLFKFDRNGRLLLRKDLRYPDLQPVLNSVASDAPSSDYAAMNVDGMQLTMVIRGIQWDDMRKCLLVLLGNETTMVLDGAGTELYGFKPA